MYPDDSSDAIADSPMVEPTNVSGERHKITLSILRRNSLEDLIGTSSFWQQPPKFNHGPDDHSDAASDSPLVHLNNVSGGPHEITFSLVFCNSLQHLLGTSIHHNTYRANVP